MPDARIDVFNRNDTVERPKMFAVEIRTIANTAARDIIRRDRDTTTIASEVSDILMDLPPNAGGDFQLDLSDVAVVKVDATEGTATAYGAIHETPDGVVTTFTNSSGFYEPGSVEFYLQGQKQEKGSDYTESDNTLGQVEVATAPLSDESLIWSYRINQFEARMIYATSELDNTNDKVKNSINDINTVFAIPPYKSGTLKVFIQGQLQTQGSDKDWTETDPAAGTFTFDVPPLDGEVVSTSSESASGSRRYVNTGGTLAYTFDGSNTRGTIPDAYKQNSLELSWNGQLLTPGVDFVETNPFTGDFDTQFGFPLGVLQAAYDVGNNSVAVGERTISKDKTADYAMSVIDRSVNADATSGGVSITLPDASDTEGMEFNIIKIDSTANAVTIIGTVNGVTDPVLTRQFDSATMRSNGTAYFLV